MNMMRGVFPYSKKVNESNFSLCKELASLLPCSGSFQQAIGNVPRPGKQPRQRRSSLEMRQQPEVNLGHKFIMAL